MPKKRKKTVHIIGNYWNHWKTQELWEESRVVGKKSDDWNPSNQQKKAIDSLNGKGLIYETNGKCKKKQGNNYLAMTYLNISQQIEWIQIWREN